MRRPEGAIFQRLKDVGRVRHQDVAGDVSWHYIEDHMGTSIKHLLGTSSGRPRDVILLSESNHILKPGINYFGNARIQ